MKISIDMTWTSDAACRNSDPELFFPSDAQGVQDRAVKTALNVCETCPVQAVCLDYAMRLEGQASHYGRFGIFGGLTSWERSILAPDVTPQGVVA